VYVVLISPLSGDTMVPTAWAEHARVASEAEAINLAGALRGDDHALRVLSVNELRSRTRRRRGAEAGEEVSPQTEDSRQGRD
jgi:hypothetical protein